jgi:hypothetical protein
VGAVKGGGEAVSAPAHLSAAHDLSAFDSGVPELDEWLRRRARTNEETGASRTYVVCAGGRIVGYYALANGGVAQVGATVTLMTTVADAEKALGRG